jgi:hypothetical protein
MTFLSTASVTEGSNVGFTNLSSTLSSPGAVSVGPGCINHVAGGGCGSADASSSAALTLSVFGTTTATGYELPEASAGASGSLSYYVIGPATAFTAVPMIFAGSLSGSASGSQAVVNAQVQLSTTSGDLVSSGCASAISTPSCGTSFSTPLLFNSAGGFYAFSSSVSADTYATNFVSMTVGGETETAGQFNAEIDPTIEIDPTWLAENPGYSLVFSSNYSPVPLPASVWLMLSALAGLGLVMRRKALVRR